jgi:hypothetical protein
LQYGEYLLVLLYKELVQLVLIAFKVFFGNENRILLILIGDDIDSLINFICGGTALDVKLHD